MKHSRSAQPAFVFLALVASPSLHANSAWPSLMYFGGYAIFWYIVLPSLVVEFLVIRKWLAKTWSDAVGITLLANTLSFAVGGGLSAFAVPLLFIPLGSGTTNALMDPIPTLIWMLALTVFLEVLAVRIFLKFKFKDTIVPLAVANTLTHAAYLLIFIL